MSRSLEPSLLSLLPTLPSESALPKPLLDLASSLLAQSRHNASTLKAEEEIARGYACAHLACERLKTTLDLPPIQARPPVNPRIYKRLYGHLDNILPQSPAGKSGRTRTPSGKAREAGLFGSGSIQRTRERGTPSKNAALAQFRSNGGGTPTKSSGKNIVPTPGWKDAARHALPSWIRPTVQSLCNDLDNQRIGRTVLAGIQTIVAPRGKRTKDEWIIGHLAPLVAAVYFMVATKVIIIETGESVSNDQYAALRRDIVRAMKQARKQIDQKGADGDVFWEGWNTVTPKDVDEATRKVGDDGWLEEDWFTTIEDLVASTHSADNGDAEMVDADDNQHSAKNDLQQGNTMLQSRWTMTDQKRKDYRIWKAEILRRVEEIEKARQTEMDIEIPG